MNKTSEPLTAASLERLALFPLPDIVMFPGALMPLHVFEPRYRAMTRTVLNGDRCVALARLKPGGEHDAQGRPSVFSTCGVGVVTNHTELEDGRFYIALRGVGRITIEDEYPTKHSFRQVRARLLTDIATPDPERLLLLHGQLLALCDRLALSLGEAGQRLQHLIRASASPIACADVAAAAVVTNADERQALLEQLNPTLRFDAILTHLTRLITQFGSMPDMMN